MYSVISANENARVWFTSGTTSATGALTITLPVGVFQQILGVQATAVRNTTNAATACFALVRTYDTTGVALQVFESRTIILGGGEGLEATTTATTVLVTVFGF